MHRLSIWATMYDCAIILISHFTKNEGAKDLYRGLGSIDVVAAARSVLQVETDSENPDIKHVKQVKNSLAPKGEEVLYELSREHGFRWKDVVHQEVTEETRQDRPMSKTVAAAILIVDSLKNGMIPAMWSVQGLERERIIIVITLSMYLLQNGFNFRLV